LTETCCPAAIVDAMQISTAHSANLIFMIILSFRIFGTHPLNSTLVKRPRYLINSQSPAVVHLNQTAFVCPTPSR
jgi:hypothetical protein